MSDHLPECGVRKPCGVCGNITYGVCICDRLRACEQRVRHEGLGVCIQHYDAGVQAAREVVAALVPTTVAFHGPLPVVHNVRITDALAAIDALREGEK